MNYIITWLNNDMVKDQQSHNELFFAILKGPLTFTISIWSIQHFVYSKYNNTKYFIVLQYYHATRTWKLTEKFSNFAIPYLTVLLRRFWYNAITVEYTVLFEAACVEIKWHALQNFLLKTDDAM